MSSISQETLNSQVEDLGAGLLLVRFSGTVGIGSNGNEHGTQMTDLIDRVIADYSPTNLIIDFRNLNYCFGDWIGAPPILATRKLGAGRVCVVAAGETRRNLSSLWDQGLKEMVPLLNDVKEVYAFFKLTAPSA